MSDYSPTYLVGLTCHPETNCQAVDSIKVDIGWQHDRALALTYTLTGNYSRLRLPPTQLPAKVDGLWKHTCFEAFIAEMGIPAYWEFNFSPSSEWAVYHFRNYRDRAQSEEIPTPPKILVRLENNRLQLDARIYLPPPLTSHPLRLALSAVIEDEIGKLSYWALKHPSGKPDFHHSDNFVLEVALPNENASRKEN